MKKENYLSIINIYKKEKNINRLIYRLIKYQYEEDKRKKSTWYSEREIISIALNIIYDKREIEEEKLRIYDEKVAFLDKKAKELEDNGLLEVEILKDLSIRYYEKKYNCHKIISFATTLNELDKTYFKKTIDEIKESILFLESIGYIKGIEVKNTNPKLNRNINLGKTKRYKSIK